MNYGTHPTGRENAILTYCSKCFWHREITGAFVNDCPECAHHGLHWIRYERGVEDDEVRNFVPTFNPPPVDILA